MSNDSNTALLELAREHIEIWVGTHWVTIIDKAIKERDYERLEGILLDSARAMGQEFDIETEVTE